jgi:hypothetical protein
MKYKITFINPKTGEPEERFLTESDCWQVLSGVYSATIPEMKIKPVNFKLELILGE